MPSPPRTRTNTVRAVRTTEVMLGPSARLGPLTFLPRFAVLLTSYSVNESVTFAYASELRMWTMVVALALPWMSWS